MAVKKVETEQKSRFQKLDIHFTKYQQIYFYLSMGLMTLFAILLFDMRISEGGDDSGYLLSAKKFIEGKSFPSFHGAFYSMMIGVLIKLTGFKLGLFKLLSLFFLLGHQAFLYYALRNRVSSFILMATLLISSVCSGLLYFGSQTYTEAFYLMVQGAFLFIFFNYLKEVPNNFTHIKSKWPAYLFIAATCFMAYTTRNVGMVTLLTLLVFYLVDKKYIPALYTFVAYQIFSIPYGLYKHISWGIKETDMSGQLALIMQKNPYNKALGSEDFSGMLTRVGENLKNYLSKIFLHELNLKDPTNNDTSLFIALLIVGVLLAGLVLSFIRKRRSMQFLLLYIGMSLGVTFIALHQMWSQSRMIIVFLPLLLITISWTFGALSSYKKLVFLKYIPIVLLGFIFLKSFAVTAKKSSEHQETLTKNLGGNKYYGYTPDWVNFLKMSEWSAEKVDETVMIGSRKPSMSFIYGKGREFFPMYRLPVQFADSIMRDIEQSGKQAYFILENELRKYSPGFVYEMKSQMYAGISADSKLYSIFLVDKSKVEALDNALAELGLNAITSSDDFRKTVLDKAKNTTAINPDVLLNRLKDNNVQYLIVASLRVNPKMKTDRTINTVARYIAGMQLKYPNIVSKVHQIGADNSEPALLVKLNY